MTLKRAIFVPSNPARTRMNAESVGSISGDYSNIKSRLEETQIYWVIQPSASRSKAPDVGQHT